MSQQQAAQAMGVDAREIRRWEKGEVPGGVTLIRLMSTYGVLIEPPPPKALPAAVNAELRAAREELDHRLAALEAKVEAQGASTTKALRALTRAIAALPTPQELPAQPATQKKRGA